MGITTHYIKHKKDINNRVDNILVSALFCEIYYDDELIDLHMFRLYFENSKKK